MPDLLEKGSAWLQSQRHKHLTRTVTYRRGGDSVSLAATKGRSEFEQGDEDGFVHQLEAQDFLVRTEDLILGGARTLPKAGDRIADSDGAQTFVYEVMAPGSEPPWRYSDLYRRTLRIHTKLVATE